MTTGTKDGGVNPAKGVKCRVHCTVDICILQHRAGNADPAGFLRNFGTTAPGHQDQMIAICGKRSRRR